MELFHQSNRAVIRGKAPDGEYSDITISHNGSLKSELDASGPTGDSIGRLRTVSPYTLFESKQCIVNDSEIWNTATNSGQATFNPLQATTVLIVSGLDGAYAIRQTYQRISYSPGKTQHVEISATDMHPQSGVVKRIGLYNSDFNPPYTGTLDGLYFESVSGAMNACIANRGNVTRIPQQDWNIDKLDGSGISRNLITDWSLNHIYQIDYQWLGAGSVRFGIEAGGKLNYIHRINYSNASGNTYIASPVHSVRYEIQSIGGQGTLGHIGSAVLTDGGEFPRFVERSISTGETEITGPPRDTLWAVLGVRVASGIQNAGGINVNIDHIGLMTTTANANGGCSMRLNPYVSGSLTWLPMPNTNGLEYCIGGANNTVRSGVALHGSLYEKSSSKSIESFYTLSRIGLAISGVSQELFLCNFNSVNNAAIYAHMDLQVIY